MAFQKTGRAVNAAPHLREREILMNEELITTQENDETTMDLSAFQGAPEKLEALKPTLYAFADSEVRQFNLSVPSTLSSAIRIWGSYSEDKPKFLATFTPLGFDAAGVSDFPARTAALWYVDVQLGQVLAPKSGMPGEIVAVAKPLHTKLADAALYLWKSDPELGVVVADIRKGAGYLDMAGDLARYATLFEDHWSKAEGRCEVTLADAASAKSISAVILESLTAKPTGTVDELKDLRCRAAEYLRRGADDIRDAATYVFRKTPTALDRYPSLHKLSYPKGRGQSKPEEPTPEPAPVSIE